MNAQVDIILINSIEFLEERERPQLGQLILCKVLAEKYSVEWINFGYLNFIGEMVYEENYEQSIEKYSAYIVSKNPQIVGLYTICSSFITAVRLADSIKKKNNSIKIVFGGPHATMFASECLEEFSFVDAVMLGESEKNIVSVVERLLNNRNLDGVWGVAYRDVNGIKVVHNTDLINEYQLTNYTVYNYEPYNIESNEVIFLEAGRGCPYACTFCSTSTFWGRKFRIKPIQHILTEMKKFHEIYGATKFSLLHDLFTANKQYIKDFCKAFIEENLKFSWDCSSRIDVLDKGIIYLLAKAGCSGIFIGIETGSPIMQRKIRKNLDIERAVKLIDYLLY